MSDDDKVTEDEAAAMNDDGDDYLSAATNARLDQVADAVSDATVFERQPPLGSPLDRLSELAHEAADRHVLRPGRWSTAEESLGRLTESSILDKHPLAGYMDPRGEMPWGELSGDELSQRFDIDPLAFRAWRAMNPAVRAPAVRRREDLRELRDKLARIDAIINNAAPMPDGMVSAIQAVIDEENRP